MNLNKKVWDKKAIEEFNNYLESIKREDKIEFSKKIVNTEMEVLGIDTPTLRKISKEMSKGDYISYLDCENNKFYENTIINACLINIINNISLKDYYIRKLVVDNWSTCDILKFNTKGLEEDYIELAKKYIEDKDTFIRRIGIRILFNYTKSARVEEIYKSIDRLYSENEYYVNMAIAWLLCELMIHNREKTIKYLENNNLNEFVINKAVSKCRDSFRITKEDKEFLLKFRHHNKIRKDM